jgi:hypothetical protein
LGVRDELTHLLQEIELYVMAGSADAEL